MYPELSFSPRNKILNYFIALSFFVGAAYLTTIHKPTLIEYRMSFILPVIGIFFIVSFLRKKVFIEDEIITSITTFRKRQLAFDEIEGIKIEPKYIVLVPNSPHKNQVYIYDYKQFENGDLLVSFLKDTFPDIDTLNFTRGHANHVYDTNYGFTPQQRHTNIQKYQKISYFINAIGVIFAIAVFIPLSIFKAMTIAIPPLCIFLAFTSKTIKLISKYGPIAYPVIFTAFIFPILTLFFNSFLSYDLYDLTNLWVPSVALGGLMTIFYYVAVIDELPDVKRSRDLTFIIILCFAYSFGAIRTINCEFDSSDGQQYQPKVIKKYVSESWGERGINQVYNIKLSAWGPHNESSEIEVSQIYYDQINIGDISHITLKQGLLNIPWFIAKNKPKW